MAGLNETPRADRVHIAFFGKTNAGKSSTINLLTGGDTALVSPVAGTTTDPVYKSMELLPVGPVVLIDTGGTDDTTELGQARTKKTRQVAKKTDVAVILREDDAPDETLDSYREMFSHRGVPVIEVCNVRGDIPDERRDGLVYINAATGEGREDLLKAIADRAEQTEDIPLTRGLVEAGDLVLLVMPQDIQAPKGRLILPQVQTIRDLLDADCRVVCAKTEDLPGIFSEFTHNPALVITDSQIFGHVAAYIPPGVPLTSFSILMAKKRGDIFAFVSGAHTIGDLKPGSKVLIAEACTHHALKGDIAREKLPAALEKAAGGPVDVTVFSGPSFPDNIDDYDLIIHCGGCMINRANMLSRVKQAQDADVPVTNFGTALAYMSGILSKVVF